MARQKLSKSERKQLKKKSQFWNIWQRFQKNKTAMVGLFIFLLLVLVMIFADIIIPYETAIQQVPADRLIEPCIEHPFGTDNYGRDIFARVIHGSRNSLLVGIAAVCIGVIAGGFLGAVCGYFGGLLDAVIMRIADVLLCIPMMLLALALVAVLGSSLLNVLLAVMISISPMYIRVVRASILSVVDQDYIEAARACGTSDIIIILKHVLPNAIGPIIVQATMSVGSVILSVASISFLGMGIQPPTPEWGAMLSEAKNFMMQAPYMVLYPGLAIGFAAFSINLMGDGLRDALDPKLKD